jgi:peptidoglycan/xylan/chitin deacetylase (PgdA/CDA1 family)
VSGAAADLYGAVSLRISRAALPITRHRQTFDMGLLTSAKRIIIKPLAVPAVARILRSTIDSTVSLFMMHRFDSPDVGVSGHPPRTLARHLAYLRKERFDLVSLADLVAGRTKDRKRPQIVFTVDDGYSDFMDVALPVFAQFDCPVSVFVATGVVDHQCWYWNDVISFAFAHTSQHALSLAVDGARIEYAWRDADGARRAGEHLNELLKTVRHEARLEALGQMTERLAVDVPRTPTRQYSAMSWDDARRCAASGLVTFGPHSVTHPVLSTMSGSDASTEIVESWRRLQQVGVAAVPVFVYPYGAYSRREVDALATTSLVGALTTEHRYSSPDAFAASYGRRRFTIPRLTYSDDRLEFLQAASGVERIKLGIRAGRGGWQTQGLAV